jgi:hypothetical protein
MATRRKFELPSYIVGTNESKFNEWIVKRAKYHASHDTKKKGIEFNQKDYREMIYNAITESKGRDFYTGEKLDWSKILRFEGKRGTRRNFLDMPTIDHHESGKFKICSWRTNDCKNDLSTKELKYFCRLILANKKLQ